MFVRHRMFLDAVRAVVPSTPPGFRPNVCPDQYVGVISDLEQGAADFPERLTAINRPANRPCVLLVLESPHIREFLEPPGPAKGSTGRLIRSHLQAILGDQVDPSNGLVLVNAVQNQCSLGRPPKEHRDAVFTSAWKLYAEAAFVQRLRSLLRADDYVINACTKGNSRKGNPELRQLVETAISSVRPDGSDSRRLHPASWASPLHRSASWVGDA